MQDEASCNSCGYCGDAVLAHTSFCWHHIRYGCESVVGITEHVVIQRCSHPADGSSKQAMDLLSIVAPMRKMSRLLCFRNGKHYVLPYLNVERGTWQVCISRTIEDCSRGGAESIWSNQVAKGILAKTLSHDG